MRVRTLSDAAAFVRRAGFAYVFPDGRVALPSLWGAVQGAPLRPMARDEWDWTPAVARAWDLKDELGRAGRAWFGRYFRGKGSLIAPSMLAPMLRLVGPTRPGELLPEGREVVARLGRVGPLSTYRLRLSLGLDGKRGAARFERVMLQLYRRLLVANVGADDSETRWASAVVGLTAARFPAARAAAARLSREEALRRVRSRAPALSSRALDALFGFRLSNEASSPS
jgi:hypothetical protein